MSITVTIKMASLLSDIRIKSHMNTERIKDPEEKYAVRAGEENEAEQRQALQDAWRNLLALCRRFIKTETADMAGSDLLETTISANDKELTFDFKEETASYIPDALAQAMHEYLLSGALRRFYTSAAMPDLVTIYAAQENAATARIRELIYYRPYPEQ